MPLIDIKEIIKFLVTTDLIPDLTFTGHADLKSTVKLENTKFEAEMINAVIDKFSNETTYRLSGLLKPKQKNDAKRAKIENKPELDINAKTMDKMADILTSEELDKLSGLINDFLAENQSEFEIDVDTAHDRKG